MNGCTLAFRLVSPVPPVARLIALPFAGGTITALRSLVQGGPGDVEVVGLELPGRGLAHREPPILGFPELLDRLEGVLAPLLQDLPVLLLGYSFGALVAAELTRRLQGQHPSPLGLVACASKAPRRIAHGPLKLPGSDAEILGRLQDLGGIPPEVLARPELLSLALPAIRADLTCHAQHRIPSPAPLGCPVMVQFGTEDPVLAPGEAEAWTLEVARPAYGRSKVCGFPGGHFYHHGQEAACRQAIWGWASDLCLPFRAAPRSGPAASWQVCPL